MERMGVFSTMASSVVVKKNQTLWLNPQIMLTEEKRKAGAKASRGVTKRIDFRFNTRLHITWREQKGRAQVQKGILTFNNSFLGMRCLIVINLYASFVCTVVTGYLIRLDTPF